MLILALALGGQEKFWMFLYQRGGGVFEPCTPLDSPSNEDEFIFLLLVCFLSFVRNIMGNVVRSE